MRPPPNKEIEEKVPYNIAMVCAVKEPLGCLKRRAPQNGTLREKGERIPTIGKKEQDL